MFALRCISLPVSACVGVFVCGCACVRVASRKRRHIVGVVDVEKCYMPEIAGYPHGNYVACFIEKAEAGAGERSSSFAGVFFVVPSRNRRFCLAFHVHLIDMCSSDEI